MSFLNELINSENDEILREELHERVDIVTHKIKFMEKVPVICLNAANEIHAGLNHLIELAGGELVPVALDAKVVIYAEYQSGIGDLLGKVVDAISPQWPAVTYNHVYILDDSHVIAKLAADQVTDLEDIAEMLHPGFFVFGNEGKNWINFSS
ncbi:hypothetical protein EZ428_23320 [Pedobacter frigiditerrae]|uniref:Iron complex transport system substrate-binding protein n=1 Tax=Pedobacter frigiditerrae TaxID=2530452 RepID=A0A4R0MKB8_9SPHI|nr:hypothetical protein [Pedobacter frigiditerrae]TCC86642.1 hypothetical protein EZ428_23320 [Pedobacter frigiditerrae]